MHFFSKSKYWQKWQECKQSLERPSLLVPVDENRSKNAGRQERAKAGSSLPGTIALGPWRTSSQLPRAGTNQQPGHLLLCQLW